MELIFKKCIVFILTILSTIGITSIIFKSSKLKSNNNSLYSSPNVSSNEVVTIEETEITDDTEYIMQETFVEVTKDEDYYLEEVNQQDYNNEINYSEKEDYTDEIEIKTYKNSKISLSYPLQMNLEEEYSDLIIFESNDSNLKIHLKKVYEVSTLDDLYSMKINSTYNILYKRKKNNFFVIKWRDNNRRNYYKALMTTDGIWEGTLSVNNTTEEQFEKYVEIFFKGFQNK